LATIFAAGVATNGFSATPPEKPVPMKDPPTKDEAAQPNLDSVVGKKLMSIDGSLIALTASEGGLSREIVASNGAVQRTAFRFINDKLGTVSGSAFGVDFGTNFHASLNDHPVKFSFTLANLGSNLNYDGTGVRGGVPRTPIPGEDAVPTLPQQADLSTKDFPLPTTFRVGLAYDLLSQENNRLTILGDFNQPNANKPGFAVGGEWASNKLGGSAFGFAVRGSYSYYGGNHVDLTSASTTGLNDEENLEGLAFGGGVNYGLGSEGFSLGLDYAYKYLGILGPTNFFSLSLGW
jgi:hypothetical protein